MLIFSFSQNARKEVECRNLTEKVNKSQDLESNTKVLGFRGSSQIRNALAEREI
jgi:hypothetical protein